VLTPARSCGTPEAAVPDGKRIKCSFPFSAPDVSLLSRNGSPSCVTRPDRYIADGP